MRSAVGRTERARAWIALVALLVTGCGSAPLIPPTNPQLAVGSWGGDDSGVIVSDSSVHVHVACTFGNMPGNIRLDASGRFTIDGTYVLRAYPVQVGPPLPAQFSGRVAGRTLTLAIAVNDTIEGRVVALGPITVVHGREPEMGPCPICRAPGMRP